MPEVKLPNQFLAIQMLQQHDSDQEDHWYCPLDLARISKVDMLEHMFCIRLKLHLRVEHLGVPFVPKSPSMQVHDYPVKVLL